jgi:hypothetical protein
MKILAIITHNPSTVRPDAMKGYIKSGLTGLSGLCRVCARGDEVCYIPVLRHEYEKSTYQIAQMKETRSMPPHHQCRSARGQATSSVTTSETLFAFRATT